jgi:4-amino-4-deoxy-L-arabinose transferase-like glycosyltransferase
MSAVARVPVRLIPRSALASRDLRWGLGIAAGALLLRVAFVLAFGRTQVAFNDTLFYQLVGMALAHGEGFKFIGHETVHWPPGYAWVLGGLYWVFGTSMRNALLLNAFLGAATTGLVYLIALRSFGRAAAIAAAITLAVLPGQLLMGDVALSETLYTFLLVAFLAMATLLRWRARTWILLGLLAGFAALTRGEGFFFPLIVLAVAWWQGHRKQALIRAAIVTGIMLLPVAGWTIRNAVKVHAFVPVATNSSDTLWSGHNPSARGGPSYAPHSLLAKAKGTNFEIAEAKLLRKEAIHYAVHHPLRELELIPLKLIAFARGDSTLIKVWINAKGQTPMRATATSVVGTLADIGSSALIVAVIAAAAAFGRTLWRSPAMRGALTFIALAIPLYGFVYYGNVRYRVPLEPLMILVVAPAAAAIWAERHRILPGRAQPET